MYFLSPGLHLLPQPPSLRRTRWKIKTLLCCSLSGISGDLNVPPLEDRSIQPIRDSGHPEGVARQLVLKWILRKPPPTARNIADRTRVFPSGTQRSISPRIPTGEGLLESHAQRMGGNQH
jgi:hypothetical protein